MIWYRLLYWVENQSLRIVVCFTVFSVISLGLLFYFFGVKLLKNSVENLEAQYEKNALMLQNTQSQLAGAKVDHLADDVKGSSKNIHQFIVQLALQHHLHVKQMKNIDAGIYCELVGRYQPLIAWMSTFHHHYKLMTLQQLVMRRDENNLVLLQLTVVVDHEL